MSRRIRILYIAYFFPPLGGVASLRSLKMVKYLYHYGIDCSVLTLNPMGMNYPLDRELVKQLPKSCRVYRSYCFDIQWLFKILYAIKLYSWVKVVRQKLLIPDLQILCKKSISKTLDHLLQTERRLSSNADESICLAVISSGPPSSLLLGLKLKNKHEIDFICDFRDEWTNNPERINCDYPHKSQQKELLWEARILTACCGVSYLTELMKSNFEQRYPFLVDKPNRIIQNGFDEEDFKNLSIKTSIRTKLVITYTGSFYDRRQPDSLWQAIEELVLEEKIDPEGILIKIIGKNSPKFVFGKYLDSPIIRHIVTLESFVNHSYSLEQMYDSDVLLLYIPSGQNTESVLTGKLFDYIRTGKPVLAIVPPEGLAAKLVTEAGVGFVSDYKDIITLKKQILSLIEIHAGGMLSKLKVNWKSIEQYSRKKQAEKLSDLITSCLQNQAERCGKL